MSIRILVLTTLLTVGFGVAWSPRPCFGQDLDDLIDLNDGPGGGDGLNLDGDIDLGLGGHGGIGGSTDLDDLDGIGLGDGSGPGGRYDESSGGFPGELPPSSPAALRGSGLRQYGMQELVEAMLVNNLEIKAQSHSISAANQRVDNAKSQQLPIARFQTAFRESNNPNRLNDLRPLGGIDDLFASLFDDKSLITKLEIQVPIYHGDRLAVLPRAARVEERIEILKREKIKQELTRRLIENYLDFLLADKQVDLAQVKLDEQQTALRTVQARFQSDVTLSPAVLEVQLAIDDIEQELLERRNDQVLYRERIAKLTGLPRGRDFRLEEGVRIRPLNMEVQAILGQARSNNLDIQLLFEGVNLGNENIAIANGDDNPRLDLLLDESLHLYFPDNEFNADVYTVVLKFSYDLYDGGRNSSKQKSARSLRDRTKTQLDNAAQELETTIRQVHNKYQEAGKLISRANRSIQLAEQNYRLVRDKVAANVMLPESSKKALVSLRRAHVFRERVVTNIIKTQSQLFLLMGQLTPAIFQ